MQKIRDDVKTLLRLEDEMAKQLSTALASKGFESNSKTLQVQLSGKGVLCFGIGSSYAIRVGLDNDASSATDLRISAHLLNAKQKRNWVGLASLVENDSVVIAQNCAGVLEAFAVVLAHVYGVLTVFSSPSLSDIAELERVLDMAISGKADGIEALSNLRRAGLVNDVVVLDKFANHFSEVVARIGFEGVEIHPRYRSTKRTVQAGTRINKPPRVKKTKQSQESIDA